MPYRLLFRAADNQSLSVGGLSVVANEPKFIRDDELPMSVAQLRRIKNLEVERVADIPVSELEKAELKAKLTGKSGIVWVGTVDRRITEFGEFKKDQPRFDLSPEAIEQLGRRSGFKKITA